MEQDSTPAETTETETTEPEPYTPRLITSLERRDVRNIIAKVTNY